MLIDQWGQRTTLFSFASIKTFYSTEFKKVNGQFSEQKSSSCFQYLKEREI